MGPKSLGTKVEHERWLKAQEWEKEHWVRNHGNLGRNGKNIAWRILSTFGIVEKYRGDDRNQWWRDQFVQYSFLPSSVESAIEVGCGPYTNLRLVAKTCRPKRITLSDPLIETYVGFPMTFVNESYRKGSCTIDSHPLEELPFDDSSFDLAVMINVLDHVRDADACMATLTRLLKPGGFVVIGQDLTNDDDRQRHPEGLELGHPVTIDEKWFDPYLKTNFKQLFRRVLPRETGWAPTWHYGTLCFGGQKLSP